MGKGNGRCSADTEEGKMKMEKLFLEETKLMGLLSLTFCLAEGNFYSLRRKIIAELLYEMTDLKLLIILV